MNDFNSQRLQADLADIADFATPVDLGERVLRGSKRRSRLQALAVSAVAAVVATGGVAFAFAPRSSDTVSPAESNPAITAAPAPSSAAPSSPAPDAATSSGTSGVGATGKLKLGPWTTANGTSSLPGTLYYLSGSSSENLKINILAGGKLRTATLQGPMGPIDCARQSIVFSPDGAWVAWVEGDNTHLVGGTLVVASLTGAVQKVPMTGAVLCDGGHGPKWMPDSRRLVVNTGTGVGIVDIESGEVAPAPAVWGNYLGFSPNGAYVAYGEQGTIVVTTAAGAVVKRVPYDINCCTGGFSVQAVSDDGRYVGVSWENSDPGTVRNAIRIVDMNTAKEVDLGRTPPSGGSIELLFSTDGDRLFITKITPTSNDVELYRPGQEGLSIPVTGTTQIRAYRP